jgi:hypothetical protein
MNIISSTYTTYEKGSRAENLKQRDADNIGSYINPLNIYISHVIVYHIFLRQNDAVSYKTVRP